MSSVAINGPFTPGRRTQRAAVATAVQVLMPDRTLALTDAEIMLKVKDGDDASFNYLIEKYRRPIISFMYRMVHNSAIAEELAQEVFLRVYRSRASYSADAKFTTWLYRIATNLAVNYARDTKHERPEFKQSIDEPDDDTGLSIDVADSGLNVEQQILRRERLKAIRAQVESLPERQRMAVLMHKYQEMDYKQIAEVLKLSESATKSLLFRETRNQPTGLWIAEMVDRETEHMNSGPNQPSSNNGGGRGRRRRRGRRGHGGAPQPQGQPQASNTQGAQSQGAQPQGGSSQPRPRQHHQGQQNRGQQNRRPGGGGKFQRRQSRDRGPANPRTPDAGIYSAPMDHSYRQNMQDDNGNGRRQAGRYQEQSAEAINGTNGNKPIYCFVDDLFFLAKIQETARKLNVKVDFVKGEKEVVDGILALEEKPSLIIFDLNSNSSKPLMLIPKLKAKLKKDTNFIGFLSHLQGDLKLKATEAGCDMVIPRSAFSQNLPQILRRHAADEVQDEMEPGL